MFKRAVKSSSGLIVKVSKVYLAIRPVAWYKPFTTVQIKVKGIDKIPTGKNINRSARKT